VVCGDDGNFGRVVTRDRERDAVIPAVTWTWNWPVKGQRSEVTGMGHAMPSSQSTLDTTSVPPTTDTTSSSNVDHKNHHTTSSSSVSLPTAMASSVDVLTSMIGS